MGFSSGGSQSTNNSVQSSSSHNQAYPFMQDTFGSTAGLTGQSSGAIANMLGLNGATGQNDAFNNYKNSSGYNFLQGQGINGIVGNDATKGLLNSGSILKGVTDYSTNMANTFLNGYLQNLTGLSNTGAQAGGLISGAGTTAQSNGQSTGNSSASNSSFSLA